MRRKFAVWVENKFGVLARVANLFSARGYNINSLNVSETTDPTVSRMTIVAEGNEQVMEQIRKQLNKLIDVIKVSDLTDVPHVERELALIKIQAEPAKRVEVLEIAAALKAEVVDVGQRSVTIQVAGEKEVIDDVIEVFKPYGIKEIARTGVVAIAREVKGG